MIGLNKKKDNQDITQRALIIFAVIIFISIGLRWHQSRNQEPFATALIVINSGTITAEIADTSERRELGLGQRRELLPRHGMYFPFPASYKWIFWMKDMQFPIDAIWIKDGLVVDVTYNAQPPEGKEIEKFHPSEPADAVLEINAGEANELNVKKGDLIRIQY